MSAFVHQRDHVDFLVTAAVRYGIRPATGSPGVGQPDAGDRIGRMLLRCNVANAARHCHQDTDQDDWEGHRALCCGYTWTPVPETDVDPLTVVFACQSMACQSSDYPEWAGSDAAELLTRLEYAALCRIPGAERARVRGGAWTRRAPQPASH